MFSGVTVVYSPRICLCVSTRTDADPDAQNLKQPYVKNGHTLPVSAGVGGGGRSPCNQGKLPLEADFRMNPAWLPQQDERRVRSPANGDRRAAPGPRGTALHEDGWRGGGMVAHPHMEGEWKANMAWQGQMEEGRRGGRLHPEDGQKRPGLQKAPSEDGRRSRPAESDWKPTLPRHASAEEGRARRGEIIHHWTVREELHTLLLLEDTIYIPAADFPHTAEEKRLRISAVTLLLMSSQI